MRQINLNKPEFWPRPAPFAARRMAQALAGVVVLLTAGLATVLSLAHLQRQDLEAAREERAAVREELAPLREARQDRRAELDRLRDEIASLQEELSSFRAAREALRDRLRATGNKAALMRDLGLARAEISDLWLTRFRLEGVEEVALVLEGQATTPELIPRYLQAVADRVGFPGGEFRNLSAQSLDGRDGDLLEFTADTRFPLSGSADVGDEP
ncbi:MAG: hypothetical protein ACLFQ3_08195 [Thiohalorhabdus sp.]